MDVIAKCLRFLSVLMMLGSASLHAEVFCVSNVDELRSAIIAAAFNGIDDEIRLRSGHYLLSDSLGYTPANPQKLIISGGWFALGQVGCFAQGNRPQDTVIDGGNQPIGISFNPVGGQVTLSQFSVIQTASTAIQIQAVPVFPSELLVDRLYLSNNQGRPLSVRFPELSVSRLPQIVTIRNSVFANNDNPAATGVVGVTIGAMEDRVYFLNNTVINNSTAVITPSPTDTTGLLLDYDDDISVTGGSILLANNIFWNNDLSDVVVPNEANTYLFNSVYQQVLGQFDVERGTGAFDPELNLANDFTPRPGSPLIDQGLPEPQSERGEPPPFLEAWSYGAEDFNGGIFPRVQGDRVDIGATESPYQDSLFIDRFDTP